MCSKSGTPHINLTSEESDHLKFGTNVWQLHISDGRIFMSLVHTWFTVETLVCDQDLTTATSQCKNSNHS